MQEQEERRWFLAYTKPRAEPIAEENLRRQSFAIYLPRIRIQRRRRGLWRDVVEPMFPRYLFVHLAPGRDDLSPVRSTRGVVGLVRFGRRLATLPKGAVESLQARENPDLGMHVVDGELFRRGDRVRVTSGCFSGWEGVFEAPTGEGRVVILLDILGRESKPVALPKADVAPVC